MTDIFIFDLGRVIIDFDMAYMTSVYVKEPEDASLVEAVVFDRKYWNRLDEGSIEDDEMKADFCSRLPERLHKKACAVYDNWYMNLNPIKGMFELVRELKAMGKRLYLLSNISCLFAEKYREIPLLGELLSEFDGLVFSAPIRMVKPERRIFEHLLEKYSLEPKECTFIDDNADNIAAAKEIGINTYLFDGDAQRLREFIFM